MYKYKYKSGYHSETVVLDLPLKTMPTAKAGVKFTPVGTTLVSYGTEIITLTADGWLTCTGTYSQTTRKHISAFMREYAPRFSYYDAKECYEHNHKLNIYTGEIVELQ